VALLSGTMIGQETAWRMEDVQLYLGHSSIAVTQRYAKLLPGVLANKITGWTNPSGSIEDSTNSTFSGAGNEIRTHDFNLGNIRLAPNTIREIQQHQPHSVPWRCVPSRGVPWKVEG
jgi:hypothetical protein